MSLLSLCLPSLSLSRSVHNSSFLWIFFLARNGWHFKDDDGRCGDECVTKWALSICAHRECTERFISENHLSLEQQPLHSSTTKYNWTLILCQFWQGQYSQSSRASRLRNSKISQSSECFSILDLLFAWMRHSTQACKRQKSSSESRHIISSAKSTINLQRKKIILMCVWLCVCVRARFIYERINIFILFILLDSSKRWWAMKLAIIYIRMWR